MEVKKEPVENEEKPWLLKALSDGISSIESVSGVGTAISDRSGEDRIYVVFKTDNAPIRDLLEVIKRMREVGYADNVTMDRGNGKGPEVEFTRI